MSDSSFRPCTEAVILPKADFMDLLAPWTMAVLSLLSRSIASPPLLPVPVSPASAFRLTAGVDESICFTTLSDALVCDFTASSDVDTFS